MSVGLASKTRDSDFSSNDKTYFGFWVYLMTDCVVFGTLIATFIVLRGSTFGGESGADLFSLNYVVRWHGWIGKQGIKFTDNKFSSF